ncbi:hypothetical protein DID77_00795 [Candidatus Marinamargulisbacteria bacterium SCGC AG-439-L15]|nr:hypothetical protein DID77_00795 [Candidatus Marinamargulisbacteria bacterium SCGC AG-439-L15]
MFNTISNSGSLSTTAIAPLQDQQQKPQVLTAEEGRAYLKTLQVGTRLYDEVQRALLFPNGIVQLSNGSKIYTTPSHAKLRGGCGEWQLAKYETPQELESLCSDEKYRAIVVAKSSAFYTVDPAKCLDKLGKVSDLLALAFASTKGFSSNTKVTEIFADYQTFVKDTVICVNDFVGASLHAMQRHKKAYDFAQRDKFQLSMAFIGKCDEQAKKMAEVSGILATSINTLKDKAKEALLQATRDEKVTSDERKEIEIMIHKAEATEQQLKTNSEELSESVAQARAQARAYDRKSDQAASRARTLGIFAAILPPIITNFGSSRDKEYESAAGYQKAATKAHEAADKLRRDEVKALSELAGTVQELKGLSSRENSLKAALKSLELAIKTLGSIKTIFENARIFWIGVSKQCERLAEEKDLALFLEVGEKDEFLEEIKQSALGWMSVGHICLTAANSLRLTNVKVDRTFSNLPSFEEARQLRERLPQELLLAIESEQSEVAQSGR